MCTLFSGREKLKNFFESTKESLSLCYFVNGFISILHFNVYDKRFDSYSKYSNM